MRLLQVPTRPTPHRRRRRAAAATTAAGRVRPTGNAARESRRVRIINHGLSYQENIADVIITEQILPYHSRELLTQKRLKRRDYMI